MSCVIFCKFHAIYVVINPLNAAPEYTRGQKMSPCRGPRVYSGAECVFSGFFLVFLSVKSMWSGNHKDSLVFVDKSLFLFWLCMDSTP